MHPILRVRPFLEFRLGEDHFYGTPNKFWKLVKGGASVYAESPIQVHSRTSGNAAHPSGEKETVGLLINQMDRGRLKTKQLTIPCIGIDSRKNHIGNSGWDRR